MRKLIADHIISLDGFYTSLKNEIDWFDFDSDEWVWSSDILAEPTVCRKWAIDESPDSY